MNFIRSLLPVLGTVLRWAVFIIAMIVLFLIGDTTCSAGTRC